METVDIPPDYPTENPSLEHVAEDTPLLAARSNSNNPRKRDPPPYIGSLSNEEREEAERALVRKIDIRLIPMVIIMYILNYLDRNNIAAARLAGLESDLQLNGSQYQTAVSILFVGYLLMQIPSNLYLNRVGKPSIYLPVAMILWGVVSTATAAVRSYGSLIFVRFLLGFVEAAYFPGCLFFLSSWYTRKELGFRTAMLYSGSLISGAFSGLLTAGITRNMDGVRGLQAWRWLFIIEGCVTVFVAICAIFVLPDFPRTTDWLTDQERELATWRLDEDIGEDDWVETEQQTYLTGFTLALADIKTWIMMFMLFCAVSSGSVNNFFPSVVQTLGYDRITSLILTSPPYLLGLITALFNAWHADRTGERYFHVTIPLYVAIGSFLLAAFSNTITLRYIAMLLMVPGAYSGFAVSYSWISSSIPRPPAKRAAALAAINAVSNSASIYLSFLFPASDAPRYMPAMMVCTATAILSILSATFLRAVLSRLNKKLERGEHVDGAVESKGFRFVL